MAYTIITGASRGLGLALACENARLGRDLILIALPGEDLQGTAERIKKDYDVRVVAIEADLTDRDELDRVCQQIADNYDVDVLINNAGVGGTYRFMEASEDFLNLIIDLNVRATVLMTYRLLPVLARHKEAYVLNIASLAALNPLPYKTIYPASKAFIDYFSKSLSIEMAGENVFVSIAYPGPMPTNQQVIDQINSHSRSMRLFVLSADKTAKILMRRLFKKNETIVPGFFNKFTWLLIKTIPYPIRKWYLRRTYSKELHVSKKYRHVKGVGNRGKWTVGGKRGLSAESKRI